MQQEVVIPDSVPVVGAAAVQLAMKVQEQAEKDKAERAEKESNATQDGIAAASSASSNAKQNKSQDRFVGNCFCCCMSTCQVYLFIKQDVIHCWSELRCVTEVALIC